MNPRYAIWLAATGGGPSWEFMAWIGRAKVYAAQHGLGVIGDRVVNHDMFTIACEWFAAQ